MRIRPFNRREDFELAVKWWVARECMPQPLFMLPPNGYVVCDGDKPVAMGFVMCTDAGVAGPCHLVNDPTQSGEKRHEALEILLECLLDRARELGFRVLGAETNIPSLVERYKRHGFTATDMNVTCLAKVV